HTRFSPDWSSDVCSSDLVTRVEPDAVFVGEERLPTRNVYWAAGNAASPLARSLDAELDRAGRVCVNPDLTVPGRPEVFVARDLAAVRQENGSLVPGVAPAAMQQGDAVAENIRHLIEGKPTKSFRYRNKGDLATIGRHKAVAKLGKL